jgi:hypothetical protein
MAQEIAINLFSGLLGGIIALISERIVSKPFLKVGSVIGPKGIGAEYVAEEDSVDFSANAYRLEIKNQGFFIFGNSAINCRCELNVNGVPDKFWLPWNIFEHPKDECECTSINRGSFSIIDICARLLDDDYSKGSIILAHDGWYHNPIKIGNGKSPLDCSIRITSENGGLLEKKFTILPIGDDEIELDFDK